MGKVQVHARSFSCPMKLKVKGHHVCYTYLKNKIRITSVEKTGNGLNKVKTKCSVVEVNV